jgi:PAS domain-containing protein
MPSRLSSLTVSAAVDRKLTPAQRKFNQLVQKIERARADLSAWEEHAPLFAQAWAQRVRPLQRDVLACQRTVVLKLHEMLDGKGWTKAERATQRELLCALASQLINNPLIDPAQAAELEALHDAYADVDFAADKAQDMAEMKQMFEAMTGLDLGDEPIASEDELMRRAHQRLQDAAANGPAEPPPETGTGRRKKKGPSAAERQREQDAKDASQSLRDVFRKLVSALHPDRADNEADRLRRTGLMQRVNQAYEHNDLLALFALQLEIEQVDAEHLANATAEKARHYNRVLSEQLQQLQTELVARETALRMEYLLDPYLRLNPLKLAPLLDGEARHWRGMLADAQLDIQGLEDRAYAKRWLKQRREELQQMDDDLPFDLPF